MFLVTDSSVDLSQPLRCSQLVQFKFQVGEISDFMQSQQNNNFVASNVDVVAFFMFFLCHPLQSQESYQNGLDLALVLNNSTSKLCNGDAMRLNDYWCLIQPFEKTRDSHNPCFDQLCDVKTTTFLAGISRSQQLKSAKCHRKMDDVCIGLMQAFSEKTCK